MTEELPNPHGLSNMQVKVLDNAERMLRSIGAQYQIRLGTFSVSTMVAVETPTKSRQKRNLSKPFGTYAKYLRPYIEEAKPGDLVSIPVGDFDSDTLLKNVRTHLNHKWGADTYLLEQSKDGTAFEVMRNP